MVLYYYHILKKMARKIHPSIRACFCDCCLGCCPVRIINNCWWNQKEEITNTDLAALLIVSSPGAASWQI